MSGYTLRLHETLGRRGTARLRLQGGFHASRVDLAGKHVADCPDGVIEFEPYQIVSISIHGKR